MRCGILAALLCGTEPADSRILSFGCAMSRGACVPRYRRLFGGELERLEVALDRRALSIGDGGIGGGLGLDQLSLLLREGDRIPLRRSVSEASGRRWRRH